EKLRGIDNVSTVEYISSEEGLRRMKESMLEGQDQYFKFLDDDNPLSCSAKITMNDLSKFDETINAIKVVSGVDSIQSHGEVAAKITSIKNGVGIAAMWIIGILMIIALVIVSNTIRVTMYNRKLEISIMKAVGATDSYIRIPFLIEGVTIGIVSAVVTTGLLYFVYKAVIETMKNALSLTQVIAYKEFLWPLLGMFAAIGVLAGLIGSVFMIGKYLKREGSEFRAL
ncbi:MAG: permease-like cell division protein FtsX, partial [Oscillospiraceae bacterium]